MISFPHNTETIYGDKAIYEEHKFERVYGCGLIYCFGDILPYNLVKKVEDDEDVMIFVNIIRKYDGDITLIVEVNDEKFQYVISVEQYGKLSIALDELHNDLDNCNEDDSDSEDDEIMEEVVY